MQKSKHTHWPHVKSKKWGPLAPPPVHDPTRPFGYTASYHQPILHIPMRHLILNLCFISLLSACGQKGALYLPTDAHKNNGQQKHDTSIH